jgi:hypothetical protein
MNSFFSEQLTETREALQAERAPKKVLEKEVVYVEKEQSVGSFREKSPVIMASERKEKRLEGMEERLAELERENEMLKRSLDETLTSKEAIIMNLKSANDQLKQRQLEDSNLLEAAQLTIKVLRQSLEEQTLLAEKARSQAQLSSKDRVSVMSELEREVERRMRPGDDHEKRRSASLTRDKRRTPRREDSELQDALNQLVVVREENEQLRRQIDTLKKSTKDSAILKGGDASSVVIDIDDDEESTRKPLINQPDIRSKRKKRSNMDYDDEDDGDNHPSDQSCWCCCIT